MCRNSQFEGFQLPNLKGLTPHNYASKESSKAIELDIDHFLSLYQDSSVYFLANMIDVMTSFLTSSFS